MEYCLSAVGPLVQITSNDMIPLLSLHLTLCELYAARLGKLIAGGATS